MFAFAALFQLLHFETVWGELKCGERFTNFVSEGFGLIDGREAAPSEL